MGPPAVTSQGEAESPVCLRSRVKRAAEEAPNASQRLISGCRGGLEPQTHAPAAISTLRTAAEAAFFICRRGESAEGEMRASFEAGNDGAVLPDPVRCGHRRGQAAWEGTLFPSRLLLEYRRRGGSVESNSRIRRLTEHRMKLEQSCRPRRVRPAAAPVCAMIRPPRRTM